jgi:hypothetical protein
MYSLYLYFLDGLSLRNTSNALEPFKDQKEVMFLYGIGYKDLDVLRRLRPRKYKYKEYITTTAVNVLFLTNLTNMYVRVVEDSQQLAKSLLLN